jgi:hypothetical protein
MHHTCVWITTNLLILWQAEEAPRERNPVLGRKKLEESLEDFSKHLPRIPLDVGQRLISKLFVGGSLAVGMTGCTSCNNRGSSPVSLFISLMCRKQDCVWGWDWFRRASWCTDVSSRGSCLCFGL